MNKIIKDTDGNYQLITNDGTMYPCSRWYEKKTDAWHIKLPADNPTGRTYIRESKFVDGKYEFDDKTTPPRVMEKWTARMTPEERIAYEKAIETIENIKQACLERKPEKLDKDSAEYLEQQIAKLQARLAQKRAE